jgi:hypothetical protein
MDLFYASLTPFLIMIASSSLTVKKLLESRRNAFRNVSSKDIKFAITSVTLNICFLLFNLPSNISLIVSKYVPMDTDLNSLVYVSTIIWYYIDFGTLFYVNLFVNSIFKDELFKMFSIRNRV